MHGAAVPASRMTVEVFPQLDEQDLMDPDLPGIESHPLKHSLLFGPYVWYPPARALPCNYISF